MWVIPPLPSFLAQQHVVFIGNVAGVNNMGAVQTMYTPNGGGEPALYQIDAADMPK